MSAAASHPELYDALREAGASESRARAAARATMPTAQAASKSEVREQVDREIRPMDKTLAKVWATVSIMSAIIIAALFFTVSAWLNAKHVADTLPDLRMEISANTRAIAQVQTRVDANAAAIGENRLAIQSNAVAIAENAQAIAENRALIEANSEKLDQLARNQEEILRLLRMAQAK